MLSEFGRGLPSDFAVANPTKECAENIQKNVWENLSEEEKKLGGKDAMAALLGFALGIRPAVFLGSIDKPIFQPKLIGDFLNGNGFDVLIHGPFLINRKLLLARIVGEADFARELGYEKDMTIEEFLDKTSPYEKNILGEARTGFVLGFPQSAIRSYAEYKNENDKLVNSHGVGYGKLVSVELEAPTGGRVYYFSTKKGDEHAPDIENLKQRTARAFLKAGYDEK